LSRLIRSGSETVLSGLVRSGLCTAAGAALSKLFRGFGGLFSAFHKIVRTIA
jgi:hypothetical protein